MHAAQPLRRLDHPDDRLRLVLEIGAVLALGVLPHLLNAMYPWFFPVEAQQYAGASDGYAYQGIVTSLQVLLPVLFIMWRSGRSWSAFGVVRFDWRLDPILAILAVVLAWVVYFLLGILFMVAASIAPGIADVLDAARSPEGRMESMNNALAGQTFSLFLVWMLVNAFAEEFVTKAYLIPRLRELFGSTWLAVLASSAAFASYHIYQGVYAACIIFLANIALAWLFVKVRRIWPFVLGHTAHNVLMQLLY